MKFIKNVMLTSVLLFSASVFAGDDFIVDVGSEYDKTNSAVFSAKLATMIGGSTDNALAFEVAVGQKTMRTNATYGFSLFDNHFFKVTDDFLYQKLKFDFGADFGKHEERVYQNAIGAAYRYDVGGSFLKGLEVSSYFSYAPSKKSTFKPEPFIYVPTDEDGVYRTVIFHGRLAGSKIYHQSASIDVSPWQDSLLTFGVDYEWYDFDEKWTKKISDTNLGGHAGFSQILLPWLKVESNHRLLQKNQLHSGTVSVLVPSPRYVQFELIGDFSYENNTTLKRDYKNAGLTLRSDLWVEKPMESYAGSYDKKALREWVSDPVVRMHDVMVLPEMKYTKDALVYTYLNGPEAELIKGKGSVQSDYYNQGARWHNVSVALGFDVDTTAFKYISYDQSTGKVTANYMDGDTKQLILDYAGYRKVEGYMGENWHKQGLAGNIYQCEEKSASSCKFKVML
jgi:hypothetical protein